MNSISVVLATAALATVCHALYRWWSKYSLILKIPGPPQSSWLYGNLAPLLQCLVGELNFRWQDEYGKVVRVTGPVGQQYLLISDPKALQYIYHTSGYRYPKHRERNNFSKLSSGKGLVWAEGEVHKRQRKVMLPAFGTAESRALIPIFESNISRLSAKWRDAIAASDDQRATIDVPSWLSRTTLDALGEAAFDYEFGALDNKDNKVARSFQNLLLHSFGSPPNVSVLFIGLMKYVPKSWAEYLMTENSNPRIRRLREHQELVTNLSRELIAQKYEAALKGKGSRDMMSLIVNANASENPATRLAEPEMVAQMQTVILAGHETTANTLTWTLYELTKQPELQTKLRAEIRQKIYEKGNTVFSDHDFDSMPYLTSVVKEALRVHPVAYMLFREAEMDDVLPLSTPITLTDGRVMTELPIPKGQKIISSVCAYNRLEEIFGEDPHTFRPERWFEGSKKGVNVGIYSNLMSFAGGLRGCIGWRFAILEMHAFLVDLINNFEFTLSVPHEKVRREPCVVMAPTIEGECEKGVQLPLIITPAPLDN